MFLLISKIINIKIEKVTTFSIKEKMEKNRTRERDIIVVNVNVLDIFKNPNFLRKQERVVIPLSLIMSQIKKVNLIKKTMLWPLILAWKKTIENCMIIMEILLMMTYIMTPLMKLTIYCISNELNNIKLLKNKKRELKPFVKTKHVSC